MSGPCADWTTVQAVQACEGCPDDAGLIATGIDVASELLWHLSGRQFSGACEATVRPCARCDEDGWWDGNFSYHRFGWRSSTCHCQTGRPCGCTTLDEITLGASPIRSVTSVTIDGALFSGFRVDDWRWLVRTDGEGWPSCQNIASANSGDDAFTVTFTYGRDVPPGGQNAAKLLACEFAKFCGGTDCMLPSRVTQLTRQGVTAVLLDPFQFFDAGRTGIYMVDAWLAAVNPHGRRRKAIFASPDVPPRVRRPATDGLI